jgi:hypothetical protein
MTQVSVQTRNVSAARRVHGLVGRHGETGYPHPQERLGSRFLPAGLEHGTARSFHLSDDGVRGVPYLPGLPGRRHAVLA